MYALQLATIKWDEDNYPIHCSSRAVHMPRMIIPKKGLTLIKHNIIQDLGWAAQKKFSQLKNTILGFTRMSNKAQGM